jgi:flavin reductase (DIM6/NTAB) family NADH-FMN oxidoreductase RutF
VGSPTSSEGWRADFQAIVSELDYPMLVVTTASGGRRAGCLVGFATQTSIHPPRMLVGLSPRNNTYRVACEARALAVHYPGADQLALAELFGGRTGDEIDKFARCRWSEGPEGLPILDACPSWIVGRISGRVDVGDHVGFVLEPVAARHERSGPQLGFQAVRHLEPGHPPSALVVFVWGAPTGLLSGEPRWRR